MQLIHDNMSEEGRSTPNGSDPPTYSPEDLNTIPPPLPRFYTVVQYKTVPLQVNNCRNTTKAITSSYQTESSLTNILGTYLARKISNEYNRQPHGVEGPYRLFSRPEVVMYNHLMEKLEKLSAAVLNSKPSLRDDWSKAVGPFRRQIFADLYNENEIVRCFALELPEGPLELPNLDDFSLGLLRNRSRSHSGPNTPITDTSTAYSLLGDVRTVVLLDDSGSMTERGHSSWNEDHSHSSDNRWDQARRILASVAPKVSQYNRYGIDLYFLNRTAFYTGLRTEEEVLKAFNAGFPDNGTPTGQRINDILDAYMSTLRYYRNLMPLNLLIITDGEANDDSILHWTIEEHLQKLIQHHYPANQLGIEFVQVGDCLNATRHLIKLEEDVSRHHQHLQRDIVGVTPTTRISNMNPDFLLAIAVSGIDARLNGYMRARKINV